MVSFYKHLKKIIIEESGSKVRRVSLDFLIAIFLSLYVSTYQKFD